MHVRASAACVCGVCVRRACMAAAAAEGAAYRVGFDLGALWHALHEVGVPAAESAHGQDADGQRAVVAAEEAARGLGAAGRRRVQPTDLEHVFEEVLVPEPGVGRTLLLPVQHRRQRGVLEVKVADVPRRVDRLLGHLKPIVMDSHEPAHAAAPQRVRRRAAACSGVRVRVRACACVCVRVRACACVHAREQHAGGCAAAAAAVAAVTVVAAAAAAGGGGGRAGAHWSLVTRMSAPTP